MPWNKNLLLKELSHSNQWSLNLVGYNGASPLPSHIEPICKMLVVIGKCLLCVIDTEEHLLPISRVQKHSLSETNQHNICVTMLFQD